MLAVLAVLLLLALAAFTLMLREGVRRQEERRASRKTGTATRLVRPAGAPPLEDYARENAGKQAVVAGEEPATNAVLVEGVIEGDAGDGAHR